MQSTGSEEVRAVPLTYEQLGLLDHDKRFWAKPGAKPLSTIALRLTGRFDPECLHRSLEALVARHSALRMRLCRAGEAYAQVVTSKAPYDLHPIKIGNQVDCATAVGKLLDELYGPRRSVEEGPLFDVRLIALDNQQHLVVFAWDQLVLDPLSMNLMFRELWQRYEAAIEGVSCVFKKGPLQYTDFAASQYATRQLWAAKHASYWRQRLSGAQSIRWPVRTSLSRAESHVGEWVARPVGKELSSRIRTFAALRRTPLSTVILAAYVALISKWCAQRDFIVPFNFAGRNLPEHVHAIGYFIHAMYLRMDLSGQETYLDLISEVAREQRAALIHQDSGRAALERPEPLLANVFTWITVAPEENLERREVGSGARKLFVEGFVPRRSMVQWHCPTDIDVFFRDLGDDISVIFFFRKDVFNNEVVESFASELRLVLERILQDPATRLGGGCER